MTAQTTPTAVTRTVELSGGLAVTLTEYGANTEGQGVLLLHGGAGPRSMAGLAAILSEHVYAIVPTHPGFDGTARPASTDSVPDLAVAYLDLLDTLDLTGVMVIGNSLGGWIASEMALRDTRGRLGCLVLLNATGIEGEGEAKVLDPRTLAPAELSQLSFHNPAFRPDFSSFTDQQRAGMAANQKAMAVYGGETFTHDVKLRGRLHRVDVPLLVVWGEQDGVAPLEYGRAYANAFPNSHFAPIAEAGHFPHIEQTGPTMGAIGHFVDTVMKPGEAA